MIMDEKKEFKVTFKRLSQRFAVNPPIKILTSHGEYEIGNGGSIFISLPEGEQTITCICEVPFAGISLKREDKIIINVNEDLFVDLKFDRITGRIIINQQEASIKEATDSKRSSNLYPSKRKNSFVTKISIMIWAPIIILFVCLFVCLVGHSWSKVRHL
jgi:hypothetical protein